ncbi:histone deacetylase-like amidohydrolase [Scenedesmus sp. PABB004]|nr:histone deacetylase-like amidohydrolase [Scenedesmus sp. PABB004]
MAETLGSAPAGGSAPAQGSPPRASRRTGYLFHELFMWHNPGAMQNAGKGLEPVEHFENADTKRRLNNLVHASGLIDALVQVKPRPASREELTRVHTPDYVDAVAALSRDSSKGMHRVGPEVSMAPGGYEIAALAAGGSLALVDAALRGDIEGGYALVRPPGHHARAAQGMGFCIFNNIALAAMHALSTHGLERVAIVDYDVHHGNGTQEAFWEDPRVLFVSLHQDSNYPIGSGAMSETGAGAGAGTTLNVPLPPGSGSGAYRAALDRIVAPALDAFAPQLILVSAGFDASFYDPLAAQMCTSEDYRYFTRVLAAAAARHCGGRLLHFHEGGYSSFYVPFCGLAVLEELSGAATTVVDPGLPDTAVGHPAPAMSAPAGKRRAGPTTRARAAAAAAAGEAPGGDEAAPSPWTGLPEPLVLHVLSFLPPSLQAWTAKLVCKAARERFRGATVVSLRCPELPLAAVQEAWRAAQGDRWQQGRLARARAACGDVAGLAWLRGAGCDVLEVVGPPALAGQIAVLEWARGEGLDLGYAFNIAASSGHMAVLRWARAQAPPLPWGDWVCYHAAARGDLAMLRWARTQDEPAPRDDWVCHCAAARGDLEMLRWARAQDEPAPWDWRACQVAAVHGHLEALRWLRANGCPWERGLCEEAAASKGHEAVVSRGDARRAPDSRADPPSAAPGEPSSAGGRPPAPAMSAAPAGTRRAGPTMRARAAAAAAAGEAPGGAEVVPSPLSELPEPLVLHVLSFLPPSLQAWSARQVCKAARNRFCGATVVSVRCPELPLAAVQEAWWAVQGDRERQQQLAEARAACGDVAGLAWLHRAGCGTGGVVWEAARAGQIAVLEWAHDKGLYLLNVCMAAAMGGQLALLRWARGQVLPLPWGNYVCYHAALRGDLEMLRWARAQAQPAPGDGRVCHAAAEGGHLEVLRWLRANGCPWQRGTCERAAADNGHAAVVSWIRAQPAAQICAMLAPVRLDGVRAGGAALLGAPARRCARPARRPPPPPPARRHGAAPRVAAVAGAAARAAGDGAGAGGAPLRTGYLWSELFFWHCPGPWGSLREYVQPMQYPEHAETKRRLHNLVTVSGLLEQLAVLQPREASVEELTRVHTLAYVERVAALSADGSAGVHRVGDESAFMPGGYALAALAAGGAIAATEAVLGGAVRNAYALCRPPGHHATPRDGGGYCIFNNVAVAAAHALSAHGLERVAIVDYDVHHGNGTQEAFWEDPRVLFVSLHQDSNYPIGSGAMSETGAGAGAGTTLNVPLPPGSGSGAYRAAFERIVAPALDAFAPQLILVSAGYDASYLDPLGHMMLGSEDFRYFASVLRAHADASPSCAGRVVAVHEGGYSELYVPFCGLAVIEELAGLRSKVVDPYWEDVSSFGGQGLQPHQDAALRAAEANLAALRAAVPPGGAMSAAPAGTRRAGPTTRARAAAAAAAASGEAPCGAEAAPSPWTDLPEPLVLHALSFLPPALQAWTAKLVCKAARERFRGATVVSLRCPELPLAAVQEAWRAVQCGSMQDWRLAGGRAACGDVAGLAWLRGAGCGMGNIVGRAAHAGQLAVLEWARDQGLYLGEVCEGAALGGQLAVLRWARLRTPPLPWGTHVCFRAAARGDLEMLRWARAQPEPAPWDGRACRAAAEQGHLEALRWLRASGCPWERAVCERQAVRGGREAVVAWIRAQPAAPDDSNDEEYQEALLMCGWWLPYEDEEEDEDEQVWPQHPAMSSPPAELSLAGLSLAPAPAAPAGEEGPGEEEASPWTGLPETLVLHVLSFLPPSLQAWTAKLVCKAARERFRGATVVSLRCPELPLAAVQEAWRAAQGDRWQQGRLARARAACGDVAGLTWLRAVCGYDILNMDWGHRDWSVSWGATRAGQLAAMYRARIAMQALGGVCATAAHGGQLAVLRWARAQDEPAPWDLWACFRAAERGQLEALRWLRANGCPWERGECERVAAECGHTAVAAWIRAQPE